MKFASSVVIQFLRLCLLSVCKLCRIPIYHIQASVFFQHRSFLPHFPYEIIDISRLTFANSRKPIANPGQTYTMIQQHQSKHRNCHRREEIHNYGKIKNRILCFLFCMIFYLKINEISKSIRPLGSP